MKLIDFIICDDIRFEMGGKHTLVGVYSDINLPYKKSTDIKLSAVIKLCFFIRLFAENEIMPDSFKLEYLINDQLITTPPALEGNFNINKDIKYLNLAFQHDNFKIENTGKIDFKLTLYKDKNITQVIKPDYAFNVNTVEL